MSSPVINSTARGLSLFPPIFYTFLLLFLVAHWAAEGDKNVISRTVTKRKKKCRHSWLGWLSRLCALLVQLQLDTRLSFAWSHYITHSLQLSSFIASFRQADSSYTHVAVNTSTQCLSQNCPHHHVYQDQWVDISRTHQMSSLLPQGALLKLLFGFKNIEHGWMDPDALRKIWRIASSYQDFY